MSAPGRTQGAKTETHRKAARKTTSLVAVLALVASTPLLAASAGWAGKPQVWAPAPPSTELLVPVTQWELERQHAVDVPTRVRPSPKPSPSTSPAAKSKPQAKPKPRQESTGTSAAGRASAVVDWALAQVGKPYRYASAGPDSFDCSGLAKAAYAVVGISIPHQTGGIVTKGRKVTQAELVLGDLVFPSSGHVGIYVGQGRIVHAPKPGDRVKVAGIYSFWTARRLL